MFKWLKEYYDIKHEHKLQVIREHDSMNGVSESETLCKSCETLRMQLAIVNQQNQSLLEKLITPTVNDVIRPTELKPVPMSKQHMGWGVRRQMLEQEDRATARIEKEKAVEESRAKADAAVEIVEKELGIKV